MTKRKDRSKIVATMELRSARKPYYFKVFLWQDIEDLRAHFEVEDGTLAMTCFEPWLVDDETGKVYINPKLGEIHFARDHWNVNVIAHEVQHAMIHRMRLIWPPAHLIMLDEYADAEEEIAYETGSWVEKTHGFLWQHDSGGVKGPIRGKFSFAPYTSEIKFPKSGLKLVKKTKKVVNNEGN